MKWQARAVLPILMVLVLGMPQRIGASSWTVGADQGIYTENIHGNGEEKEEKEIDSGKIEKWVAGMITNLAKGLDSFFSDFGMSLNQIICGRVGSGSSSNVALFTFELQKNNPYGTISALLYHVVRRFTFLFMALLLAYKFVRAIFQKSGTTRADFKTSMGTFALNYGALFLMPFLLDLWLYVRDQILYVLLANVSEMISGAGGDAVLSLTEGFQKVAEEDVNLCNSIMYLASVGITLFFAFEYAGMALAMMLMFMLFPFICFKANLSKNVLDSWVNDIFSISVTPLMDVVLLMVPLLLSVFFPEAALLKIICCAMVIPSRNVTKRILGLTSTGASLMNGMMALAALRSANTMRKKAVNKIGDTVDKVKNGRADLERGRMEDELASADQADEKERMQSLGYSETGQAGEYGKAGEGSEVSASSDASMTADSEDANKSGKKKSGPLQFGLGGLFKRTDKQKDGENSNAGGISGNWENGKPVMEEAKDNSTDSDVEDTESNEHKKILFGRRMGSQGKSASTGRNKKEAGQEETAMEGSSRQEIAEGLRKERGVLQKENESISADVAEMKLKKAGLEAENSRLKMEEVESDGIVDNSKEIAKNHTSIAELNHSIAGAQAKAAQNKKKAGRIEEELGTMGEDLSNRQGKDHAKHKEIMARYAKVSNFESPEFSSLSHADKAKLYRKRAARNFISAGASMGSVAVDAGIGMAVGSAYGAAGVLAGGIAGGGLGMTGSAAGAIAGAGAGLMYGPAGMVVAASAGSALGSVPVAAMSAGVSAVGNVLYDHMAGGAPQTIRYTGAQGPAPKGPNNLNGGTIPPLPAPSPTGGGNGTVIIGNETTDLGNETVYTVAEDDPEIKAFIESNFQSMKGAVGKAIKIPGYMDVLGRQVLKATSAQGFDALSYEKQIDSIAREMSVPAVDLCMKAAEGKGLPKGSSAYKVIRENLVASVVKNSDYRAFAQTALERNSRMKEKAEREDYRE